MKCKEFSLRNWVNVEKRRTLREKQGWQQADQDVDQELCFGHAKCER